MKKAKKVLLLVLCAVLLVGASVAGTLAYLTSEDSVTNTFTVGKVNIVLEEKGESGVTDKGLLLHLVPGVAVTKEPYVTVLEDSEDCYVRVKVTVDVSAGWTDNDATIGELTFANWAKTFADSYLISDGKAGFNTVDWSVVGEPVIDTDAKTIEYILTYICGGTNNIIEKDTTENTVLASVFDEIRAPGSLTNKQLALLEDMVITVEAHAIQAAGFEEEVDAWKAFDKSQS